MNFCLYILYLYIIFSIVIYAFNVLLYPKKFYKLLKSEIKKIEKCFNLTKRITCSRNSSKMYIRRKTNKPFVLLLHKYNCNNVYFTNLYSNYLVVITTEPDEFYERYIFRKIYRIYHDVNFVFAMGKSNFSCVNKKVEKEIKLYSDIIQFDFLASYYSLMVQTYNILLWALRLKIKYKWLIKHDSDTFFNINMLKDLQTNANQKYLKSIWGYILGNFPSGMGYAIPYQHIKQLVLSSLLEVNKNRYRYPEDVYIGRIAKRSHIMLFDVRNYNKSIGQGSCLIKSVDLFFMIHRLKPSEILYLHYINNIKQ